MTTFTMKSCATSTQFIAPIKGCRRRRNNLIADDETLPDRVNLSPTQVQLYDKGIRYWFKHLFINNVNIKKQDLSDECAASVHFADAAK